MRRFPILMASTIAACASGAGHASPCSDHTVPIQNITYGYNSEIVHSAAGMSDPSPHFRALVATVTEHVAARLAEKKICLDSAKSKKRTLLQFANWPVIIGDQPIAPAVRLNIHPPGGCQISSPWIDLVFVRTPDPWIRGIIRWNERQLLTDQAVLAGGYNVPSGLPVPLSIGLRGMIGEIVGEYDYFSYQYVNSEIMHRTSAQPIEERVPPDLLWVFRRSSQSTRSQFNARYAMDNVIEKGMENYTKLVIALIDRCFSSDGGRFDYFSIIDVADFVSLEQYKINMSFH